MLFRAYVEQFLAPTLAPGDIVIIDNLGNHRSRAVRNAILTCGAKLAFLPPYSPDLNPIEQVFAKVKHWMRMAEERCIQAVHDRVASLVDSIPARECANVSWDSLFERHMDEVLEEDAAAFDAENEKKGRQSGKYKKVCVTDPDATMATNARNRRLEPAYKQHTAGDDKVGVILDVEVTTGQTNEGDLIEPQVYEVIRTAGARPKAVTAHAGYAYAKVYAAFEKRDIDAVIPAKAEPIRSRVPLRRFRYDAKNDILKCPTGRILRPKRPLKYGRFF